MKVFRSVARIALVLSLLLTFAQISTLPVQADTTILRVAPYPEGLSDITCGETWDYPCDLQFALQNVVEGSSGNLWELWLKTGDYYPGVNRTDTFTLTNNLTLYGGFGGSETVLEDRDWNLYATTLNGDITAIGSNGGDAYHVVTGGGAGSTSVLDGLTISGGYADTASSGYNNGGGFYNNADNQITIRHAIITNNYAASNGGGIYSNWGSLHLSDVTFSNNTAGGIGGGFYRSFGTMDLNLVTFDHNSAGAGGGLYSYNSVSDQDHDLENVVFTNNSASDGGGLFIWAGLLTLKNLTFSSNQASGSGGGIYNEFSDFTLNGATLTGNTATNGGGFYNHSPEANPTLTGATFDGNTATYGGGLYNFTGSPVITDSTIRNNTGTNSGGGFHSFSGSPVLTGITFLANHTGSAGGGLYLTQSNATLNTITFEGNTSGFYGGGIFIQNTDGARLTNITLRTNTAVYGGGVYNWYSSPPMTNLVFDGNSVRDSTVGGYPYYGYGGGLYNNHCSPSLTNALFVGNTSTRLGAGIYNDNSGPTITNTTFTGNTSDFVGGAMYGMSSNVSLMNVTVTNNTAQYSAGLSSPGGNLTIQNSILWGNSTNDLYATTVAYSLVQGGYEGAGNLDQDPLLGTLGDYGGGVPTLPLLPGSPAIDAGTGCPDADQRGVARPQGEQCDMGAYEARPFTLTITGGSDQQAVVSNPFSSPLVVSVTGTGGDPVEGGKMTFTAPTSGASTTFSDSTPTISAGTVTTTVTANGTPGSYTVQANAAPGAPAEFALTNYQIATSLGLETSTASTRPGNPITFTATLNPDETGFADPTGTVTFYKQIPDGEPILLGEINLSEGVAAYTTSSLTVGNYTVYAIYSGDAIYLGANSLTAETLIDPYILILPVIYR